MIRLACEKDIDRILQLLSQVLEIHAQARPDIFISGTTKYGREELEEMLKDSSSPIYVAVDQEDRVLGYAFCQIKKQPASDNLVPFSYMYIDDLCVDSACRGQHLGQKLFEYVKDEAEKIGCYEVCLNVWTGNEGAETFYEKMGMKTKKREMEFVLRAHRD